MSERGKREGRRDEGRWKKGKGTGKGRKSQGVADLGIGTREREGLEGQERKGVK